MNALLSALNVVFFSSFVTCAFARMTPEYESVLSLHIGNRDACMSNMSYVYESDWRKVQKGETSFSKQRYLFRRSGEGYLLLDHFTGWESDKSKFDSKSHRGMMAISFDGKIIRQNNIIQEYLKGFVSSKAPIESIYDYDKIRNIKEKRGQQSPKKDRIPRRWLPSGVIREPDVNEASGHRESDHFLEALALVPGRRSPARLWSETLSNGTAVMEDAGDGIVLFRGLLFSKEEISAHNPELTQEAASDISSFNNYEIRIDTNKNGLIISSRLFEGSESSPASDLEVLECGFEEATGLWYPKVVRQKMLAKNDSGKIVKELDLTTSVIDISFNEVDEKVFTDFWIDEQTVTDKRNGEMYYYLKNDPESYNEDAYLDITRINKEARMVAIADTISKGLDTVAISDSTEQVVPDQPVTRNLYPLIPQKPNKTPWTVFALLVGSSFLFVVIRRIRAKLGKFTH